MPTSLLTRSGASVGVSISTQRRIPSRIILESKGLEGLAVCMPFPTSETDPCHSAAHRRCEPQMCDCTSGNLGIPGSRYCVPGMTTMLALVGTFAHGDLLDQFDDAAPELGVGDACERAGQRQALGGRQKIGNVSRRGAFGEAFGTGGAAGPSLEQKRNRDLKDLGDLLDTAGADPVGTFFVFLNLLECEAQCFAELFLTHAQHDAAHAHATADIFVNRVRRFGRHFQHSLGCASTDEASETLPQAPMPSNLARKRW